nr:M28 family peptidase [Flavobacterium covae]
MNIYKLVGILLVSSFIKLNAQETEYQKEERIKKIIQFLASDENKGREPGTPEMENVMVFLEKEFKENKIKPFYKTYRDKLSDYHKPAYNIVGVIEGNDPDLKNEYVVIGAHYDHIGNATEVEGDIIANGANDNAVGTTAVLEVMRYFSEKKIINAPLFLLCLQPKKKDY